MFNLRNRIRTIVNGSERSNKEIMTITYIFVAMFMVLVIHIIFFTAVKSESFINNSYNNSRANLLSHRIIRGTILSRDNEILARTKQIDNFNNVREYPYGNVFAHAVGFFDQGSIGVESAANFTLLRSDDFVIDRLKKDLNGVKNQGDTVITTLDTGLQKAAYNAFGSNRGAVVVMNAKTGEILALVSKPDFDPNEIDRIWDQINEDTENSPLLNRATQGLYPPGSTFKIVTVLEYMKENPDISQYEFDCVGNFSFEDVTINCYHGQSHGHLDINSSFAKSCNSSFANISSQLDRSAFGNTCKTLLFNGSIPCPLSYKQSYVDVNADSDAASVIQAGIGQGKTQITPIHMAMITAAAANDGMLMEPYIISEIKNSSGGVVRKYDAVEYGRLMSQENAGQLRSLMREVVQNGTGTKLKDTIGYEAAGKTGSAEYSKDKTKSHAWFTGFAPFDDPEIVVTVIAEEAGSGGEIAVPVARAVFDEYFKNR